MNIKSQTNYTLKSKEIVSEDMKRQLAALSKAFTVEVTVELIFDAVWRPVQQEISFHNFPIDSASETSNTNSNDLLYMLKSA